MAKTEAHTIEDLMELVDQIPDPAALLDFVLRSVDDIKNSCMVVLDTNALLLPYRTDSSQFSAIIRGPEVSR